MTGAEDWSHKGLVVKYVHLGPLWYLSVPVQHTPKMSKNNFLLKEQASNKNQHFLKPFWEWTLLLNSIFYTKVTKNICHTSNVFEIPPVKPSSRYNGTTCPNRNINQVVFSPLGGGIKNAYAFVNHQDIDRITWMKSMTWAIHSGHQNQPSHPTNDSSCLARHRACWPIFRKPRTLDHSLPTFSKRVRLARLVSSMSCASHHCWYWARRASHVVQLRKRFCWLEPGCTDLLWRTFHQHGPWGYLKKHQHGVIIFQKNAFKK